MPGPGHRRDRFPGPWRAGGFLRLRLTGGSPRLRRLLAGCARPGARPLRRRRLADQPGRRAARRSPGHHRARPRRDPPAERARPARPRYRRNLRTAFRRAALVVAVSEHIRQQAIALGADPAKVRVHHIGVPAPRLPQAPETLGRALRRPVRGEEGHRRPGRGPRPDHPRPPPRPVRRRRAAAPVDPGPGGRAGARRDVPRRAGRRRSSVGTWPRRRSSSRRRRPHPTATPRACPPRSWKRPGWACPSCRPGTAASRRRSSTARPDCSAPRATRSRWPAHQRLLADEALRARLGGQARRHADQHFDLGTQTLLLEDLYETVAATLARLLYYLDRAASVWPRGCGPAGPVAAGGARPVPAGTARRPRVVRLRARPGARRRRDRADPGRHALPRADAPAEDRSGHRAVAGGQAGPARKYYRLTADGHARLRARGSGWPAFQPVEVDALWKGFTR